MFIFGLKLCFNLGLKRKLHYVSCFLTGLRHLFLVGMKYGNGK